MTNNTKQSALHLQVRNAIRAGFSGIWIRSSEHPDALRQILDVCLGNLEKGIEPEDWTMFYWNAEHGTSRPNLQSKMFESVDAEKHPSKSLEILRQNAPAKDKDGVLKSRTVLVMRNPTPALYSNDGRLNNASLLQMFWHVIERGENDGLHVVVLATDNVPLIPEVEKHFYLIEHDLPQADELWQIIRGIVPKAELPAEDSPEAKTLIDAASGLTRMETSGAVGLALYNTKPGEKVSPSEIWNLKTSTLSKGGLLSIYRGGTGFDFLGGLNNVKDFCLRVFNSPNRSSTVRANGIGLVGVPGCVADDTRITYLRGGRKSAGDRSLPIDVFCDKFNGHGKYAGPQWDRSLDTFIQSFDADSGKLFYNKVLGVIDKGTKPCVTIRTADSGDVTLTYDHPVLVADGTFVEAGQLEVGDILTVRGDMKPKPHPIKQVRRPRRTVEGLKYYRNGWQHKVKDQSSGKVYNYQRTHYARLVVEARMNGMSVEALIDVLKTDAVKAENLVYLPPEMHVHHLDEDPLNDKIENLVVTTAAGHAKLHDKDETNFNVEYTRATTVIDIVDAGERRTYDVEMECPAHNFVVNDGVIVHNTGKSAFAKALGVEVGLPTVVLDFGALMGSFVGQTESQTRRAFKTIDALAPAIVFVD